MEIDWNTVADSLEKSIRRNQHAHGESVPKLAVTVLALAEAERRRDEAAAAEANRLMLEAAVRDEG